MSGTASSSQLDRIIASCLVYLSVERNLSPRTLEAYRGDYRSFAASLGAGDAWRNDAKAAQEWLADANVAVSTTRRRAAALRVLYRFAEGEGELTRSLSGEIDLPRTRRNLPAVLRPDEVERLLVALAAPRDGSELAAADAHARAHLVSCSTDLVVESVRSWISILMGLISLRGRCDSSGRGGVNGWSRSGSPRLMLCGHI